MLKKTQLHRVDLNLLLLFEAVFKERHVARAAEHLNVSPSAVSHGLKRLRGLLHDPLFLRNPKGVVPTARATLLAEPIADILARTRHVMASAEPFDAAKSTRRFVIGAPDGVTAVLLPPLLTQIRKTAPGIDLAVKNLVGRFETALTDLDERTLDVALIPVEDMPARFAARMLYEEDFVIVKRSGHRLGNNPSLERYCAASHLVVSLEGDPHGFVDRLLAQQGHTRRVALTVPNFMLALAVVAESDLISAMPRRFVAEHAERYSVTSTEAPVPLRSPAIRAITPRVAMMDAGLVWLLDLLERIAIRKRPRQP